MVAQPMGRPDPYAEFRANPSFEALGAVDNVPWTATLALDLLPENNGPKVEVYRGSVVVSPHAGFDHQDVEAELIIHLKGAARRAGLWFYHEVNIMSGDDLFIPDIVVLRRSGAGQITMPITEAVLLGEIVSPNKRRKDVIDRPREYAAAAVPWYLRVEFRNRVPTLTLHRLVDGAYEPVVAAAAGSLFEMTEPFAFAMDPADLLYDEIGEN
jgi:Uma2 family endonuclease